jgi:hypothetical protein
MAKRRPLTVHNECLEQDFRVKGFEFLEKGEEELDC